MPPTEPTSHKRPMRRQVALANWDLKKSLPMAPELIEIHSIMGLKSVDIRIMARDNLLHRGEIVWRPCFNLL